MTGDKAMSVPSYESLPHDARRIVLQACNNATLYKRAVYVTKRLAGASRMTYFGDLAREARAIEEQGNERAIALYDVLLARDYLADYFHKECWSE